MGAPIQAAEMKLKRKLLICATVAVGIAAVAAGAFSFLSHYLLVEAVEVSMDAGSKEVVLFEEIKTDLAPQLKKLIGSSMIGISFSTLSEELMKDQRIKNISLRREFPATISLRILPHDPIMAWVDQKGFVRPVARDNQILPRLRSGEFRDFALLRGSEFSKNKELRKQAIEMMLDLPAQGYFRRGLVSEIRYDKASGFELVMSEPAVIVKIGTDNYKEKSLRLEKVFSYIQKRGIKGRVIDSRLDKKVVVRLRNEP